MSEERAGSRLEVTPVTAIPIELSDTHIMQRLVDEAEYVLAVLYRMQNEVAANPKLFDPDAPKRMDEAIARNRDVLQSTRSELKTWMAKEDAKAA